MGLGKRSCEEVFKFPTQTPRFEESSRLSDSTKARHQMAVGQNQWYHFGVGAPPILVYVSGDWDVHWGVF